MFVKHFYPLVKHTLHSRFAEFLIFSYWIYGEEIRNLYEFSTQPRNDKLVKNEYVISNRITTLRNSIAVISIIKKVLKIDRETEN